MRLIIDNKGELRFAGGVEHSTGIKGLRAALGMSQAQFAQFCGIQVRTLQGWELGRKPAADQLLKVYSAINAAKGASE